MRTGPIPGHLVIVEVDEYWQDGGHGNPAEGSHLQGRCLYSRTKFDSILWGDCAAWHEEIQLLFFSEWRHHQVQYWVRLQIQCAHSDGKIPVIAQQLVLLVSTLHRRLGSCIDWTPSWVRYLEDGVGNWQEHLGKT